MDYFIPKHTSGYYATDDQRAAAEAAGRDPARVGLPYEFFRGIHHVPDALADSHHANAIGIVPVEEMGDEDWRLLGLNKDAWMAEHRPQPETPATLPEKAEDARDVPEAVEPSATETKAPAAS